MKKILLDGEFSFSDEQQARLGSLGVVQSIDEVSSDEEWLEAVNDFDVICTWGDRVMNNLGNLENVLVTYPYTELGSFYSGKLAEKNVYVANARGGNRKSIVEWTVFEALSLFRQFPTYLRTQEQHPFNSTESLEEKNVLIIGHGAIGTEVGERLEAFSMKVSYFSRGDDLKEMSKRADLIVNALNCNPSSENLLDEEFFSGMKRGSFYVTFSRPYTYDIDGLIKAIEAGVVAGAGIDCDPEPLFDVSNDFYKKCLSNEKILVTPHVAGVTKQASVNGLEIMVQNVEKYLQGNPQNILKKQ